VSRRRAERSGAVNKPDFLPKLIAEKVTVLEAAGIESAKVEIEWILCHVLDVDRLNLYLHGARLIDDAALKRVE